MLFSVARSTVRRNTWLRLVFPPSFFGALAAFCLVYNRTEQNQGFFIRLLKTKWHFLHLKKPGLTQQFVTPQEYRESKTRLEEIVDELKKELSTAEHNLQKYNMETKVPKPVKALWHPAIKSSNQLACRPANNFRVFDDILSRLQKLWSRCRRKQTRGKGASFWKKFECIELISSVLERKLECLNRTQTSVNFGFIIQWQHINALFKLW